MHSEFEPIVSNPHLLTIAANFWPRKIDERAFPPIRKEYRIDDCTTVVAYEHQPSRPKAQILGVHGLEGSANAGYLMSFGQAALSRGFGVHRINLRTCGGTERLCQSTYHSGLTSDIVAILQSLQARGLGPAFLAGFSLGGNIVLKLAGELGETTLLAGVCAVSTPIDLTACVRMLEKPSNVLYSRRFLNRLRSRIRRKSALSPERYSCEGLDRIRTIWEFDDRYTAQLFGFGSAANYYETQSAIRYLDAIRVSTVMIAAEDDPLVPIEIYRHPAFASNPALQLLVTKKGGHLGFISKSKPRFWLDKVCLDWMEHVLGPDPVVAAISKAEQTWRHLRLPESTA